MANIVLVHAAAFLFTFAGVGSLYLGAPRQLWLARPWQPAPSRLAGAALLLLGWLFWRMILCRAAATFAALAMIMALFIAFPGLAALAAARRGRR